MIQDQGENKLLSLTQLELFQKELLNGRARTPQPIFGPLTVKIHSTFGNNRSVVVCHGDVKRFLQTVPSKTAKLIISSPPYNLGKQYETSVGLKSYLEAQKPVIDELVRVLRDDGSLCWEVGNYVQKGEVFPLDIFYYDFFKNHGLKLRNRIIWHFEHGLHASRRFSGRYECILWFTKTDHYTFNLDPVRIRSKYPGKRHYKGPNKGRPSGNPLGKNPSDFWRTIQTDWEKEAWDIPNVKANHPEKTLHPCQFPVELVERCVLALTDPGDWVLDPYAGVGSALIAGIRHNRKVMGSEREKLYVLVMRQRILDLWAGKLRVRPLGKRVYEPSGHEKVVKIPPEWTRDHQDSYSKENTPQEISA